MDPLFRIDPKFYLKGHAAWVVGLIVVAWLLTVPKLLDHYDRLGPFLFFVIFLSGFSLVGALSYVLLILQVGKDAYQAMQSVSSDQNKILDRLLVGHEQLLKAQQVQQDLLVKTEQLGRNK